MSLGQTTQTSIAASAASSQTMPASPVVVLCLLATAHTLVDTFAGSTQPLWPLLEQHLNVERGGLLWIFFGWMMATSVGQLLIAIWADRRPSRWLIWWGPLLAVCFVSVVGWARTPGQAMLALAIGGIGVAAFHPEAAATAGAAFPNQRSRAMAIFALSGYFGQSIGPIYSGFMADWLGLKGLAWGLAWGLPILAVLCVCLRHAPAVESTVGTHAPAPPVSRTFPSAWLLSLLLLVGALRLLPALGIPLALAYLLEGSQMSNALVGAVQSSFMAGIGLGAIVCAAVIDRKRERTALWLFPLLAAPVLACLGLTSGWPLVGMVSTCGVLLGITMPVYISYGQQLLPNSQRVASSITMGMSWGCGGAIVAVAMWYFTARESLTSIFVFFAIASAASAVCCHFLPTPQPNDTSSA